MYISLLNSLRNYESSLLIQERDRMHLLKDYISGNGRPRGNDRCPKGDVEKAKLFDRKLQ